MDAIQAIGSLNSNAAQRWQNHSEMMNLQMCEPEAAHTNSICHTQVSGAHLTPSPALLPEPPSGLNVKAAAAVLSGGLKNGFYDRDMNALREKITASQEPGSTITSGEITLAILEVSHSMGLSDMAKKVSEQVVQGIQNAVIKQG